MKYTKQQIMDFQSYEEVRAEGRYNMLDPNARALTGLDREAYTFVMKNYEELLEQSEAK